jgi:hypothetical protein
MRWSIAPTDKFVVDWISVLGLPNDADWPGGAIEAMARRDLIKLWTQGARLAKSRATRGPTSVTMSRGGITMPILERRELRTVSR